MIPGNRYPLGKRMGGCSRIGLLLFSKTSNRVDTGPNKINSIVISLETQEIGRVSFVFIVPDAHFKNLVCAAVNSNQYR